MITQNVSTLKINKLTKEQYNRELENGNIDETALYLTPDDEIDLSNTVDLTSDQTIDGVKTFEKIKIGNAQLTYDATNNRLIITIP